MKTHRHFLPKAYSLKPMVLAAALLLLSNAAFAAGLSSLHSLSTGTVSITNTQKNSSWHPVALLFRFNAPVTGTITVTRQTVGQTFRLATVDLSGNQYAVWLPEASIPFNLSDVLGVTSTVTNGTIEIIRKAD